MVNYDSTDAYQRLKKDPEFVALKKLRSEAIDVAGIDGEVIDGALK
ncbi:hypothetical protein [Flagellimonas hymeniacidonis]|nr:hypothetical protein [Flagellimonas hymeniacidonis]